MWTTTFDTLTDCFTDVDRQPWPSAPLARSGQLGMRRKRWEVFVELYLDRLSTRACAQYCENVRKVLRRFGEYCRCDDLFVDQISIEHLDRFVQQRRTDTFRGKAISNRTINNEINILNAALTVAGPVGCDKRSRRNYGFTSFPPFADLLEEAEIEPVCTTPDQSAAMLASLRTCGTPHVAVCDPVLFWDCVVLLLYSTALRRSGLLRIPRPDDQTFIERGELLLPARFSKVRKDQRFVLDRQVVSRLASLPSRPGEPLLPWRRANGSPMSPGYFNEVIRESQRKAGISEADRVTPKHLRSTVATLVSDQFGDAVAKKRLGHSPKTNTIATNYKSRQPTERDRDASTHLARIVLPLMADVSK